MTWTKILLIAFVFSFSFTAIGQTTNEQTTNEQTTEDCPSISPLQQIALLQIFSATDGENWDNSWDLTAPICEWYGVDISSDGVVTGLNLSDNNLTGTLPAQWLCFLNSLTTLNLFQNELEGSIPSCIGELTELKTLNLSDNNFTDTIPASIYNLTNLTALSLNGNQLVGEISDSIGNLSSLTTLNLSNNNLSGELPEELGNLQSLLILLLNNNTLVGTIPESLGTLNSLIVLGLNDNQLSGNIPESFPELVSLFYLDLGNNQLSGNIPAGLSNLVNLRNLLLDNNSLEGELPEELGALNLLEEFTANNNLLSGCFPDSYRIFCDISANFIDNTGLPANGDFDIFCSNPNSCREGGGECLLFEIRGADFPCYMEDVIAINILRGTPNFLVQIVRDGIFLGQFSIENPSFQITGMPSGTYDVTIIDANDCQATEQLIITTDCQIVSDEVASSRSQSNATIIDLADIILDNELEVFTNYPNPFTQGTTLPFVLSTTQDLSIRLVNSTGQQVYQLNQTFDAGNHQLQLEENIFRQAGLYLYQIQYGDKLVSGKLIKLK